MPYDPRALTENERAKAYYAIWAGAAGNAVLLAGQFLALPALVKALCILATAASLVIALLPSKNDDYFSHLAQIASRFAMGVLAVWFCVVATDYAAQGGYVLGELVGGGNPTDPGAIRTARWLGAETLAALTAMAFHIRFLFERYRT